jgi:hypothetical protein
VRREHIRSPVYYYGIVMVLFLHTHRPLPVTTTAPPNQREPETSNTTDLKLDPPASEGQKRKSVGPIGTIPEWDPPFTFARRTTQQGRAP